MSPFSIDLATFDHALLLSNTSCSSKGATTNLQIFTSAGLNLSISFPFFTVPSLMVNVSDHCPSALYAAFDSDPFLKSHSDAENVFFLPDSQPRPVKSIFAMYPDEEAI